MKIFRYRQRSVNIELTSESNLKFCKVRVVFGKRMEDCLKFIFRLLNRKALVQQFTKFLSVPKVVLDYIYLFFIYMVSTQKSSLLYCINQDFKLKKNTFIEKKVKTEQKTELIFLYHENLFLKYQSQRKNIFFQVLPKFGSMYVYVCVFAITDTVQPRTFKFWHNIPYVNI